LNQGSKDPAQMAKSRRINLVLTTQNRNTRSHENVWETHWSIHKDLEHTTPCTKTWDNTIIERTTKSHGVWHDSEGYSTLAKKWDVARFKSPQTFINKPNWRWALLGLSARKRFQFNAKVGTLSYKLTKSNFQDTVNGAKNFNRDINFRS
jgi:hypothetical protein